MMSSAPRLRHHSSLSGRDAVAMTRIPASCFASWMAIDPTPPAPPITRDCARGPSEADVTVGAEPIDTSPVSSGANTARGIAIRSNSASHAVIVVSGMAAASSKERLLRLAADDALVHDVILAIAARPGDAAGVIHLVPWLEQR